MVPVATPAPGPAPPGGFDGAATTCLADVTCPMDRYAGFVLAAIDAGERSGACSDLLSGNGVPVDLRRARTCFEREVEAEGACGQSSPSHARLQLALLHVTGRGGPLSSAEAAKRLDGCFEDASVQEMRGLIEAQATGKGVNVKSIELCSAELA